MAPFDIGIIGVIVLLIMIILRFPIAFALVTVGCVGLVYLYSLSQALYYIPHEVYSFISRFTFTAVPLFLMMGCTLCVMRPIQSSHRRVHGPWGVPSTPMSSSTRINCSSTSPRAILKCGFRCWVSPLRRWIQASGVAHGHSFAMLPSSNPNCPGSRNASRLRLSVNAKARSLCSMAARTTTSRNRSAVRRVRMASTGRDCRISRSCPTAHRERGMPANPGILLFLWMRMTVPIFSTREIMIWERRGICRSDASSGGETFPIS